MTRARRWQIIAAAIAIAGLVLTAAVHLPFVRARVLSWAAAELGRRGIQLQAERLHYNLFALTVGLDRVTMRSVGAATPFFEADTVRLNLPLSALAGKLRIQSIDVARPRLTIIRSADGTWNLPPSSGDSSGP